jgi:glucarate dehydratase
MRVIPVAGCDRLSLNLSGAHAPFFTRNLILLADTAGHTGAGEVPGGEKILQILKDSRLLVIGEEICSANEVLHQVRQRFASEDQAGRGSETFDLRTTVHAVTAIECALLGN